MSRCGQQSRRSGVVTLELILTLPIWLIALFAVIEFGLIVANRQHVALASRVGAAEASETGSLPTTDGDPVPQNVMKAIQQQLSSSGITQCKVLLQHDVVAMGTTPIDLESGVCDFSGGPVTCTPAGCACDAPDESDLPTTDNYVRVSVYVPVTQLAPNLLASFGIDLSSRYIRQTTTFRYEL